MAGVAAVKMATAAFGSQINLAKKRVYVVVEGLVRQYVPYSVRAVVAEFPSYFEKGKHAYVTTSRTRADGYVGHEEYIFGEISFYIPSASKYILVCSTEYNELKKLNMRVKTLEQEKDDFQQQVYDALIALKTENKVRESFPEALPFIDFPEEVHLPAPVFETLRQIYFNNIDRQPEHEEKK